MVFKQNKIQLDSILLLVLGFYFLYAKSLHTLIYIIFFIATFAYLYLDLWQNEKARDVVKKYLLIFIIGVCLATTLVTSIIIRKSEPNNYLVHDNVLQIEVAQTYLLNGKNPYTEDYFGTSMESANIIRTTLGDYVFNTALLHCVKLPWDIVSGVPFKLLSEWIFGFWDQRILYLILYIASLFICYALPKTAINKRLFTILYAFNPLFVNFVVTGRGDVFVLTWLLLAIYLLKNKKYKLSALVLGLACVGKHSAWFFVPFYTLYLYWQIKDKNKTFIQNSLQLLKLSYPFIITFLLFMLPFAVWDFDSFWQDIYQFPAGSLVTSYHINGYGFSMLLYELGIIETIHSLYPAWVFQMPLGIVLFYFLYKYQKKYNTISQSLTGYGLFVFIFWLFSRFFHDNYIGYLSMIFLIACFIDERQ